MSVPADRVVHIVTLDSVFQLIKAQRPTWLPPELDIVVRRSGPDQRWVWNWQWSSMILPPRMVLLALHGAVRIAGDQEACDVVVWKEDCQGETADSGRWSSQNDRLETASFDGPSYVANLAAYAHASGIRFGPGQPAATVLGGGA